jgi:hypothetical protein
MSSRKIEAIVVLFLLTSGIIALAAASPGPAAAPELKRGIGYAFLGAAFIMVIILLVIFVKRKKEEKEEEKVEKVIRLLKEMKRIKEEIDRRGEKFTSAADIASVLILSGIEELKSGIGDLKALLLLGIGVTIAFGISIILML